MDLEEIKYIFEDIALCEMDNDSLEFDDMDLGETISFYCATDEHIVNIKNKLNKEFNLDLNELNLKKLTMIEIVKFIFDIKIKEND